MSALNRRTFLQSAFASALFGKTTAVGDARGNSFETVWTTTPVESGRVEDAARLADETYVVAVNPGETDVPDLVGLEADGSESWRWRWDTDRSNLSRFEALAPDDDGGLFLAYQDNRRSGFTLVHLDADQSVAWDESFDLQPLDLYLVRPTTDRLILVSTIGGVHENSMRVYGFDVSDRSLAWEIDRFDEGEGYSTSFICRHRDGCVLGGTNYVSDPGWIARISGDGTVDWEQTYPADQTRRIHDAVVAGPDHLVAVGERSGDRDDAIQLLAFDGDGTEAWSSSPTLGTGESTGRLHVVADQDGGYVVTASRNTVVASVGENGSIQNRVSLDPVDGDSATRTVIGAGDTLVLAGTFDPGSESYRPWVSTARRPETSSTRSPTASPTATPTVSATPPHTLTGTPTATPTDKPASPSQSTERRAGRTSGSAAGETTADGAGFGVLATLAGVLGAGAVLRRKLDDGE